MKPNQTLGFHEVNRFLDGLFDGDLHAKRVLSLANATLGVIRTASLAVNTIGQGLALARGLVTKHAIKQVDRLLSNQGIDIDAALRHWVPYVVGPRPSIKVAMDWTACRQRELSRRNADWTAFRQRELSRRNADWTAFQQRELSRRNADWTAFQQRELSRRNADWTAFRRGWPGLPLRRRGPPSCCR